MKSYCFALVLASAISLCSCNESSTTTKKTSDSAYSGLEGTREDASQLSNATIDTSSGQTVKKSAKDSITHKESSPVK